MPNLNAPEDADAIIMEDTVMCEDVLHHNDCEHTGLSVSINTKMQAIDPSLPLTVLRQANIQLPNALEYGILGSRCLSFLAFCACHNWM